MKHDRNIEAAPAGATPNGFVFAVISASIVPTAYAVTLAIARQSSPPHTLIAGAANMIPTVVFGAAAYRIVRMWIVGRPIVLQAAGHIVLMLAVLILLFRDFLQPITILVALPLSVCGAMLALLLYGGALDLSSTIVGHSETPQFKKLGYRAGQPALYFSYSTFSLGDDC